MGGALGWSDFARALLGSLGLVAPAPKHPREGFARGTSKAFRLTLEEV